MTVYSPLVANGAGRGTRVGVVGIGGLGHFGVLYAKALECKEIVAISRTSEKKADAMKMGATKFIATDEDPGWEFENSRSLDLIVSTVASPRTPLMEYLQLLRVNGTFIQVGAPGGNFPSFSAFSLIAKGVNMRGSSIGSPWQLQDMLDLSARKGVHPWIMKRSLKEVGQAVQDIADGGIKYRCVLYNGDTSDL